MRKGPSLLLPRRGLAGRPCEPGRSPGSGSPADPGTRGRKSAVVSGGFDRTSHFSYTRNSRQTNVRHAMKRRRTWMYRSISALGLPAFPWALHGQARETTVHFPLRPSAFFLCGAHPSSPRGRRALRSRPRPRLGTHRSPSALRMSSPGGLEPPCEAARLRPERVHRHVPPGPHARHDCRNESLCRRDALHLHPAGGEGAGTIHRRRRGFS